MTVGSGKDLSDAVSAISALLQLGGRRIPVDRNEAEPNDPKKYQPASSKAAASVRVTRVFPSTDPVAGVHGCRSDNHPRTRLTRPIETGSRWRERYRVVNATIREWN